MIEGESLNRDENTFGFPQSACGWAAELGAIVLRTLFLEMSEAANGSEISSIVFL
jgi:hypothetical protein